MPTKGNALKFEPTVSQLKDLLEILELDPRTTVKAIKNNLNVDTFKLIDSEESSVYHMFSYKPWLKNMKPVWKNYRGTIVKDYNHVVADSNGHTPKLTITEPLPLKGSKKFKEILDDGKVVNHTLDFTKGKFTIRPAFNGTLVRVWKSEGVVTRSTLRKWNMKGSKWAGVERTFDEIFNMLCDYDEELFGEEPNSPYCHSFLMCAPELSANSHIDVGEGFVIYLETLKCYEPEVESKTDEPKSFLFMDIPADDLDDDERDEGISKEIDRLVYPLESEKGLTQFIPPPSTSEGLDVSSAVYTVGSMSIKESNNFTKSGVSGWNRNTLAEYRNYPLLLPGESLFYSTVNKGGYKQTYILSPPCDNYRSALVGNPNSRQSQLMRLNDLTLPSRRTYDKVFFDGSPDLLGRSNFNSFCFSNNSGVYPTVLNIGYKDTDKMEFFADCDENKVKDTNEFDILAYHYILAINPRMREDAYESYISLKDTLDETMNFIFDNKEDFADVDSEFYKLKAFGHKAYFQASERIRDMLNQANNPGPAKVSPVKQGFSVKAEDSGRSFKPKKKEYSSPSESKKVSYAKASRKVAKNPETDPKKIRANFRNMFAKEEYETKHKIVKLVALILKEESQQEA
jgi:hypothetical protein